MLSPLGSQWDNRRWYQGLGGAELGCVGDCRSISVGKGVLKVHSTAEGAGGWLWEICFPSTSELPPFPSSSEFSLTVVVSPCNEVCILVSLFCIGDPRPGLHSSGKTPQKLQRLPMPPAQSPGAHLYIRDKNESLAKCEDKTAAPLWIVLVSHFVRKRGGAPTLSGHPSRHH